jgi:hypothetical protein
MGRRSSLFCGSAIGFLPSGSAFDAATIAWVNAVIANGGSVSNGRKILVDNLIVGLKADGLFTKLDRLWLFAAENQPSALTDIIADQLATAVNSPTFTTDRGYTGQDQNVPTQYIDTNYNPSTNGVQYTQNAAHASAWCVGNVAPSVGGALMGLNAAATTVTDIYDTFSDGNVYARINEGTPSGSQGAPGTRAGQWLINRSGSGATQLYQNGSLFSSPNSTSGALANGNFFVTCENFPPPPTTNNGTPNQVAMASMGGNLNGTDASNLYSRLRTYMTAVGVP